VEEMGRFQEIDERLLGCGRCGKDVVKKKGKKKETKGNVEVEAT